MSKANKQFEKLDTDQQHLLKMRHSAEHVLTMAMRKFYPDFKMAMGPATQEGFYFDVDMGNDKVTKDDFKKIEKEMYRIINQNYKFEKEEIAISEARKLFKDNQYKQEWLDEIEQKGQKATLYYTARGSGDEFVDLCSGPHVNSTTEIKAIKLLSVAGAYWRGDEHNKMLTRIYGTAFASKDDLQKHLHMLEEAQKRDHKKLGKELGLFSFSDKVGAGLALWSPKGTMIRTLLDDFVWELRQKHGYHKVTIPHITKKDLYETSGHWDKFKDELFIIKTREGHLFAMKPMNCPHHTQIFDAEPRSYRDMPQRYCETTMCYRDEQSGELNGLSRVRCITQDDSHVFCRYTQIEAEVNKVWDIVDAFYKGVGFKDLKVRLSLHDPDEFDKYIGSREVWQQAEDRLLKAAQARGVEYYEQQGEAAMYGPKIDFMAYDALGREWQVATIQLDMNMPERFALTCVSEKGEKERIVMLHVAIMGSIERFMSILIEHYAGAFPTWLSPVQVNIIPISEKNQAYAQKLTNSLKEQGVRVELSDPNESMQKRIRQAEKQKIPYMLVVGEKEASENAVAVRMRGKRDLGIMKIEDFITKIHQEIVDKLTE